MSKLHPFKKKKFLNEDMFKERDFLKNTGKEKRENSGGVSARS